MYMLDHKLGMLPGTQAFLQDWVIHITWLLHQTNIVTNQCNAVLSCAPTKENQDFRVQRHVMLLRTQARPVTNRQTLRIWRETAHFHGQLAGSDFKILCLWHKKGVGGRGSGPPGSLETSFHVGLGQNRCFRFKVKSLSEIEERFE